MALRKVSAGHYAATGPLKALVGPGRRTVGRLELRQLGAGDDLSILSSFPDLAVLELGHVHGVDLSPLADLALEQLSLVEVSAVDLGVLARLPSLQVLGLVNVHDVRVPPLRLARSLAGLTLINDAPDGDGEPIRRVVEAIEWGGLAELEALTIQVGGLHELAPIEVQLGFLRSLPALNYLVLAPGVHHAGPQPSPLDPPFDGLSTNLSYLRAEVADPDAITAGLRAHLGSDAGLSLRPLRMVDELSGPWALRPLEDAEGWVTYGSLLRAERGTHDDTEYDAEQRARRRLRDLEPALLKRLQFDPESSGTGIWAASRADLETTVSLLGLRPIDGQ